MTSYMAKDQGNFGVSVHDHLKVSCKDNHFSPLFLTPKIPFILWYMSFCCEIFTDLLTSKVNIRTHFILLVIFQDEHQAT